MEISHVFQRDSDFDREYESGKTAGQVIGGGIIAVIVIVIVLFISSMIAACCVCSRRKERRRQHDLEMRKHMGEDRSSTASNDVHPAGAGASSTSPYGQGTYPSHGYAYNNNTGYSYSKSNGNTSNDDNGMPPAYTARDGASTHGDNTQSGGGIGTAL
ncbi:hypothetical protein CCHR01_11254 [Colletotrichum chrysophilum]|uniref:Uncharacterized protein n=1 Tax=Colletotrichum chrysophilum TaxID=1836956 RepID=A0AAD9AIB8_9PEZI|nr:hypothetical protein CCHR01_11254 [Colletotrichum chrysophilum]